MKKEEIPFTIPDLSFNIKTHVYDSESKIRKLHYHRAVELIRYNYGKVSSVIDGRSISLNPGEILVVGSQVVHYLDVHMPSETTYMQIDLGEYGERAGENKLEFLSRFIAATQNNEYFIFSHDSEVGLLFEKIVREVEEEKPYYNMYVKAYITELCAFFHRNGVIGDTIRDMEKLYPIVEYIDSAFDTKITLDSISEKTGFDKFGLCRFFKQATGGTVVDYINFVRMKKAVERFSTSQNISEIAYSCGFASVQYFNKVFKKAFGCTPKEFKKKRTL